MDMQNLQVALSSTLTLTNDSTEIYSFELPRPQYFSIQQPLIQYMIKNMKSAKTWNKLIKTCKYFFPKTGFPINHLKSEHNNYIKKKWIADGKLFELSEYSSKLWVFKSLYSDGSSTLSDLIQKVYKFDLCSLNLMRAALTWNEYQKLTSSGSILDLRLYGVYIRGDDGELVPVDKIVENLYNAKCLSINYYRARYIESPRMFDSVSVKKMFRIISGFKNLRSVSLTSRCGYPDIVVCKDFFMKNETIDIGVNYWGHTPDAYKEVIKNVLEEVKKNPHLKIPYVWTN